MTSEIIDFVRQTMINDLLLGAKSLSHMIAVKLHLSTSVQTLKEICRLLRFRATSPCHLMGIGSNKSNMGRSIEINDHAQN
jgi:hypothetical protein